MTFIYVDTSALANRYLPAAKSESIDALLETSDHSFAISELCRVELESGLMRQHREGRLTARRVEAVRSRLDDDLRRGFFAVCPLSSAILLGARALIASGKSPLKTLDSIHLQTALDIEVDAFATDDHQLASASARHGLRTITLE